MKTAWSEYTKPVNWPVPVWELDPDNSENNGYENEDLIVWMRTAALPTFRKLYRKLERDGTFNEGLPKGKYQLSVDYDKYYFLVIDFSFLIRDFLR